MSFSGEVKEELVKQVAQARHCQIAELAAILEYTGSVRRDTQGNPYIEIQEETPYVARKCFTLLKKTFNIETEIEDEKTHIFTYRNATQINKILQAIKYTDGDNLVNPLVMKSVCCKRAFLRGAFLSIGSMSNPEKGYHLEFVCQSMRQAIQIQDALITFDIEAKTVQRKLDKRTESRVGPHFCE